MQTPSVTLLLAGEDSAAKPTLIEAAQLIFSPVQFVHERALDRLLERRETVEDGLLVLLDPSPADKERAENAVDAHGLSGWPIVVLLSGPVKDGDMEGVPKEIWTAPVLAHAMRAAVARHALLKENQRLRGDLLTVARRISHDLRNPLSSIVSTGDMLKEMLSETEPQAGTFAEPLFNSVDGLVALIERVSLLLKATSQRALVGKVDMKIAVYNTLQRLERLTSEKKVKIQQPAVWPDVRGVESWIEVIWWNLIRNALQHAKEVSHIELGWDQQEGTCHFWVKDDGKGITPNTRKRLFQPFHSLHEPGSAHGLGLAIVQRLVEMQGGVCGYEALENGGACFSFTLPQGGAGA